MNIGEMVEVKFEGKIVGMEIKDNQVLYTIQEESKDFTKQFAYVKAQSITRLTDIDAGQEKANAESLR